MKSLALNFCANDLPIAVWAARFRHNNLHHCLGSLDLSSEPVLVKRVCRHRMSQNQPVAQVT